MVGWHIDSWEQTLELKHFERLSAYKWGVEFRLRSVFLWWRDDHVMCVCFIVFIWLDYDFVHILLLVDMNFEIDVMVDLEID